MPKVLIVDDDRLVTSALAVRLRAAGMEVATACSAHDAADIVLHERPDLILLDIQMPAYTGLEFHECLMFAQHGRNVPVVYLSASTSPVEQEVAFRQGARAFLRKPFETCVLLETIRRVLEAAPTRP